MYGRVIYKYGDATSRDAIHYKGDYVFRKFEKNKSEMNKGPFKSIKSLFQI